MHPDDDLTPFDDSAIYRALTAPGESAELAGEDAAAAMFRANRPRQRRHLVGRIGFGASTLGIVLALGGGVAAAAYTNSLPDPIQRVVHEALGPIGVPAPQPVAAGPRHHHHHHRGLMALPVTTSRPASVVAVTTVRPAPSPHPTTGGRRPSPAATPAVGSSPSAAPSASASPSASPTGPAGAPSTWSISGSLDRALVVVHKGDVVRGTLLDAAGKPVSGHRVVVAVKVAGSSTFQQAGIRMTDANGQLQFFLADLTTNEHVVLRAGNGVHTQPMLITVRPVLGVTVSNSGGHCLIGVNADGGRPGDTVALLRRRNGSWVRVGTATLDSNDSASFSVPTPKQQARYAVRLLATSYHGPSFKPFVVSPS
jgi:hypothetical protein